MTNTFTRAAFGSFFAATLVIAAVPASAMSGDPKTETESTETTPEPTVPAIKADQKYCIAYTPTGSHIQRRGCRTLQEWRARGIELILDK